MSGRSIIFVLALAACGDNSAVHADAPPVDAPTSDASGLLQFTPCRTAPLECATLIVPADWSAPDSGTTVSLPVVRAKARDAANRIGVLTFNFGGPGGATLDEIASAYPQQPIASATMLADRFDFVVMDWRGVATTTPELLCLTPQLQARLAAESFAPATDQDWNDLFALVADVGAGCAANTANAPLLAHQDSDSAARDFDALRAALGEDKLNMWVVSYGTRLGAMYATLFPDRVRAIVLDSPMPPAPDFESFLSEQNAAFEGVLARFFTWCDRTPSACAFHGNSAAAFEQLLDAADTAPITANGVVLTRAAIDLGASTMMYFPAAEWKALGTALADLAAGNGKPMAQLYLDGNFTSDDNSFTTYENVIEQDIPIPSSIDSPATYRMFAESLAPAAPHIGLINTNLQAFDVGWPATVPSEHAIAAPTAPPMLITATRNDPATPYANAAELQQAFGNGSYLITYEGDGHGNGSYSLCLGDATVAFLVDPTGAPATTDCPEIDPSIAPAPAFRPHLRKRL